MKRKAVVNFPALFVLLFPLFVSCNNSSKSMFKADNGVEFDSIHLEKKYFLDNNPENPACNLTVNFIYPKKMIRFDTETVKSIFVRTVLGANYDSLSEKDAIDKYAENYVENYKNDARIYKGNKPVQEDAAADTLDVFYLADDDHAYLPEIFYSYYEDLSDSIVYNHHGIISYQVKQTNNKGGNMSYTTVRNCVINLSTGKLMAESDIFYAGYDAALRPIIQNALLEANNVKSIQDLEDLGFFGIDEILPNKNFLITGKGIVYTFNKGEYSAYQLQAPEVFIPYEAIRSLLRDNSVVSLLSRLQ